MHDCFLRRPLSDRKDHALSHFMKGRLIGFLVAEEKEDAFLIFDFGIFQESLLKFRLPADFFPFLENVKGPLSGAFFFFSLLLSLQTAAKRQREKGKTKTATKT